MRPGHARLFELLAQQSRAEALAAGKLAASEKVKVRQGSLPARKMIDLLAMADRSLGRPSPDVALSRRLRG